MGRLTRTDISMAINILSNPQSGDESDIRKAVADAIEAMRELQHYKDLEERIEKLFDGKISLNEAVEEIEKKVHGEEVFRYSRILTNAEAEKWDKWLDLEEQGYKMVNINKIVEQLEDVSCYIEDRDGHAGHLVFTDEAIEIVKGGAIWNE